jgi:hypothetical protein
MQINISIDPRRFADVTRECLERGNQAGVSRVGLKIEGNAKRNAPVDSGSLVSSITSQIVGVGLGAHSEIGPNVRSPDGAPYDYFQEVGTGLYAEEFGGGAKKGQMVVTEGGMAYKGRHPIRPRWAKVLAWKGKVKGTWQRETSYTISSSGSVTSFSRSTQFHGDQIVARWVRGTKPTHYMSRAVDDTDVEKEYTAGFNSAH